MSRSFRTARPEGLTSCPARLRSSKRRVPAVLSVLTNKIVGLISTAGGLQGLQAVNTMEFVVRALRGWAVPLVIPVARAWQAFDEEGRAVEKGVDEQLRLLGREVTRAAQQFKVNGYCDYSEYLLPVLE